MHAVPTRSNVMHKRSHSVRGNTCKALLWILSSSSLQLALMLLLRPGTLSPRLSMLAGTFLPLSGEHTHKLWLLGLKASGVSLASWPTSSSTPLQTKIDSIFHPSQSSKNVNKEQKLPVLHISEGLFGNRAFLKLILLPA